MAVSVLALRMVGNESLREVWVKVLLELLVVKWLLISLASAKEHRLDFTATGSSGCF